ATTMLLRLELERGGKRVQMLPAFRVMSAPAPSLARLRNVFGGPVFGIRRDVFNRTGGFATDLRFARAWHWEYLARLLEGGERGEVLPFCFGSWHVDVARIDRDWPWGPVSMFVAAEDSQLTTDRRQQQMLDGYVRSTMPAFEQVRRALRQTLT